MKNRNPPIFPVVMSDFGTGPQQTITLTMSVARWEFLTRRYDGSFRLRVSNLIAELIEIEEGRMRLLESFAQPNFYDGDDDPWLE